MDPAFGPICREWTHDHDLTGAWRMKSTPEDPARRVLPHGRAALVALWTGLAAGTLLAVSYFAALPGWLVLALLAVIVACAAILAVDQIQPGAQTTRTQTVRARLRRFGRWLFDLLP